MHKRVLMFAVLCPLLVSVAYAQGFKRADRDPNAVYAVHATKSSTEQGKWNMRETIKLCALATPIKDERGTRIKYIAVSPSNECPK